MKIKRSAWFLLLSTATILVLLVTTDQWVIWLQMLRLQGISKESKLPATLWVHRVNSPQRLKAVLPYFEGFEMDLVYDKAKKKFRIGHPPATPQEYFLEDAVRLLQGTKKQIWLDIKALEDSEKKETLNILNALEEWFPLKTQAILELYSLETANFFAARGYTVSYALPVAALQGNKETIENIRTHLLPSVFLISLEDKWVESMHVAFPEKKLCTWSLAFHNFLNRKRLRQLLAYPEITCVLVNIKSAGYR